MDHHALTPSFFPICSEISFLLPEQAIKKHLRWSNPRPLRSSSTINPLSPIINMHLLHTVLHTFLMVLLERICSNITTFHLWWQIISFILMTCLFVQAVLLLGEIACGSLLMMITYFVTCLAVQMGPYPRGSWSPLNTIRWQSRYLRDSSASPASGATPSSSPSAA